MAASSTTTALALLEEKPTSVRKPNVRDKNIWILASKGWSDDQLAVRFKISVVAVQEAKVRWMLYAASLNPESQDLAISEMFGRLLPKTEKVMTEAMKAEHLINVGRGREVIMKKVADHATRLKSVEMVKTIIEVTRPKGGGITVNTQVNNGRGEAGGANTSSKGFDFEARLRDIRERKGLANEADDVVDAEFVDEETDELADELAEMGIELDEDEDDGGE